ncbi:hypothetical protein ACL9RM_09760 [Paenibacillus sp. S29]
MGQNQETPVIFNGYEVEKEEIVFNNNVSFFYMTLSASSFFMLSSNGVMF